MLHFILIWLLKVFMIITFHERAYHGLGGEFFQLQAMLKHYGELMSMLHPGIGEGLGGFGFQFQIPVMVNI